MTDREHSPPDFPTPYDQAVATAVEQLLEQRGESVVDLAHFSRISVASLYRKLSGHARWTAADVGRIAEHYGVRAGALFGDDPPAVPRAVPVPRPVASPVLARPFSHAQ